MMVKDFGKPNTLRSEYYQTTLMVRSNPIGLKRGGFCTFTHYYVSDHNSMLLRDVIGSTTPGALDRGLQWRPGIKEQQR